MEHSRRTPLAVDVTFYALCAVFAGATAWWSTLPAHQYWGSVAVGGYLPAAIVAGVLLLRYAPPVLARVWVAIGASLAVTVMPLLGLVMQRAQGVSGRFQEEVAVVEDSGQRLWQTGSPYSPLEVIATADDPLLAYNPYQPGMALFGLPRALLGQGWLTDARIWFAVATLAAGWYSITLLARAGVPLAWRVGAIQALGVLPLCALTLSTGGDDLPVLAGCVLALSAIAAGRYGLAGIAVGAAATLKLFAWPVLVVTAIWAIHNGKWRVFLPGALVLPLASLIVALPNAADFVTNVVDFPLGNGVVTSPAQSPLPGFLIARYMPGGEVIALALLVVAALSITAYLLWRPPADAAGAAGVCATGLLTATALLPATRFGYLLYPAVFGVWWWLLTHGATGSAWSSRRGQTTVEPVIQ